MLEQLLKVLSAGALSCSRLTKLYILLHNFIDLS